MLNLYRKSMPYAMALTLLCTGCIDDNYDLSDIDTLARVSLNDLTLPVEIEPITLSDIVNLDEDGSIKIIDGEYVFVKSGSFSSAAIEVGRIIAYPNSQSLTEDPIDYLNKSGKYYVYGVDNTTKRDYEYTDDNVDENIVTTVRVACETTIDLLIGIKEIAYPGDKFILRDADVQFPKGLELTCDCASYDPGTGILHISEATATAGSDVLVINTEITAIDIEISGAIFDDVEHRFELSGDMYIISGQVYLGDSLMTSPSKSLTLTTYFSLEPIEISSLSGIVKYSISDVEIEDAYMGTMPDVFSQDDTNLILANPQIYLSLTNPLWQTGFHADVTLSITPWRGDTSSETLTAEEPFEIRAIQTSTSLMSPSDPAKRPDGFSQAVWSPFSKLSQVFAGNGIPSKLSFKGATNAPEQEVSDFKLGSKLGSIEGTYLFYAPMQFLSGSRVIYSETRTGWFSDDFKDVTFETLKITATASSHVPVDLEISCIPVDYYGNEVSGVTIEGASLKANALDQELVIYATGVITGLDGLTFTARLSAGTDTDVISEDDYVILEDIKVNVTGYYEKEL